MKAQQIFKNKNISTSATSGLTSTTSVWELSWTSRVLIHSLGRPEAVVGGQGTRLAVTPNQASPPGPSSWVRMRGVDGSRRRLWPSKVFRLKPPASISQTPARSGVVYGTPSLGPLKQITVQKSLVWKRFVKNSCNFYSKRNCTIL